MKRDVLNSPRLTELKKHRQRVFWNKLIIFFVGILIIFIFLAYLSRINRLNISSVEITGNKIVDTQIIQDTVKNELAGKYLWLFPKSNLFLYPENTIKNILQDKFKRLKNINLSLKNNSTLVVSVAEREPSYIWCGATPTTNLTNCYFLDENGYIFDQAPYFSGDVYFKFYGAPTPALGDPSGTYFFQPRFKELVAFRDILISLGLKPISLYETSDGDIQVYLSSANKIDPPKIILKADADFQNVAENLQAALGTEPLQSKFKNNYVKLQYIDLRFGNKVYDKFE